MARPLSKSLLLLTRTLHIYATMLALILLIFFSFTGFVMNHPEVFGIDAFIASDTKLKEPLPAKYLAVVPSRETAGAIMPLSTSEPAPTAAVAPDPAYFTMAAAAPTPSARPDDNEPNMWAPRPG